MAVESKAPYLITTAVMILLLIVYGVWLFLSSRNRTGFFKNYEPTLGPGLKKQVADSKFVPMTDAVKAKKAALLRAALA